MAIVSRLDEGKQAIHQSAELAQKEQSARTQNSGYPPFIVGLGPLKRDSVNRCEQCNELTSFSYGGRPLCCLHARQQSEGVK